jgi:hypothetical protein
LANRAGQSSLAASGNCGFEGLTWIVGQTGNYAVDDRILADYEDHSYPSSLFPRSTHGGGRMSLFLLFVKFALGAEPVLFVLARLAATTFIQLVGPLPYSVWWDSVRRFCQRERMAIRCDCDVCLQLLLFIRIEHTTPLETRSTKRGVLQMNCLSPEDLKEERKGSLTFDTTLNQSVCPMSK